MPPARCTPRLCLTAVLATGATLLALSGCGASKQAPITHSSTSSTTTSTSTTTQALPGTGKPPVVVGDKNYTEQFVLGELYAQALRAQGFSVSVNRNIGPSEVTLAALRSGGLSMYPEYLDTWNTTIASITESFPSERDAYAAAQGYAIEHGFELLTPTPFSDTGAIGVTYAYATEHDLRSLAALSTVESSLMLGAPLQFKQSPTGLPALEAAYGFMPAAFKPLDVGEQYAALASGAVQAAEVGTTDGQLLSGRYTLLADPKEVFGFGNVVPVVPQRVLSAEGPAFSATVDRVSALLDTSVMRQLNYAVDGLGLDPTLVAQQFLLANGLIPPSSS